MRLSRPRLFTLVGVASVAGAALASAAASCASPYVQAAEPDAADLDASAEADVTQANDAAIPDPCAHTDIPSAPTTDDAPGVELPTFYVAVETIALSSAPGQPLGFDLDGVCTCDTRPGSAFGGAPSCKSATSSCDLDGGIDNTVSSLSATLSPFFSIDSVPQNLVSAGRRTLLIQIGKYNGQRNDPEVALGFTLSDGIHAQGCASSVLDTSRGIWSPGWCGDDPWSLLSDNLIPGTSQPFTQAVGYVKDGVLAARLPTPLPLVFDAAMSLQMTGTVIAATLVPLGDDLQMRPYDQAPTTDREKRLWSLTSATIGGRASATTILEALGNLSLSNTDGGPDHLCETSQFPILKTQVCGARDIASDPSSDHDLMNACDALSLTVRFTAFPVVAGDVESDTLSTNPCSPQTADAGTYVCP